MAASKRDLVRPFPTKTPPTLIILALATIIISCSPQSVQTRLPIIGTRTRSIGTSGKGEITLSFGTTDRTLVANDYSVATATMISPVIEAWSIKDQMIADGETLYYSHPLLGAIRVDVHVDATGRVTYSGILGDNQSRFTAIVEPSGKFRMVQTIVASVIETAEPPVQSCQIYTHSFFAGTINNDGGYVATGNGVNVMSTVAYLTPPNPEFTTPTGTEGYYTTCRVKAVPSKSFFGIEFYKWDGGYSDTAPARLSVASASVYDPEVITRSVDPQSAYLYMFYWLSGLFYQIPWNQKISSADIPATWDKY